MSETRWKFDDDGLLIERPHAGVRLDPDEATALLDALLQERGYEKRWAVIVNDHVYEAWPTEDEARSWAPNEFGGANSVVPVYVPLQREEPE